MSGNIEQLRKKLKDLYHEKSKELLFHGWHHIVFVTKKSLEFAKDLNADKHLTQSAALVHDLNYMLKKYSIPEIADEYSKEILGECNYSDDEIKKINQIIKEEEISSRDENISNEAKALSDADTLFKALPTTPIIFTSCYIKENNIELKRLAQDIIEQQKPLIENGIYFYSKTAKEKYLKYAKTHLLLWEHMSEVLEDKDVLEMLSIAKELKVFN
jgi:uncharacterized protein